jgi:hypothetical protein
VELSWFWTSKLKIDDSYTLYWWQVFVLFPGIPLPNICASGLNMAPHPIVVSVVKGRQLVWQSWEVIQNIVLSGHCTIRSCLLKSHIKYFVLSVGWGAILSPEAHMLGSGIPGNKTNTCHQYNV